MKTLKIALIAAFLLWACPVLAQEDTADTVEVVETTENAESTESEDADDTPLFDETIAQDAPEGTNEYEEIHQVRVLERTLLPPDDRQESGAVGTLMPGNLMELSHDSAMHVLLEGAGDGAPEQSRGLQRKTSRWMKEAVAQIRSQMANSKSPIAMPFGLDCADQPAVQEYVAIFSHAASGTMKTWLKRLEKWRPVLEKALKEENVPTDLLYLAMIESGFKTRVKSPASAAGMWQFMAGTGVEMGLTIDEYVDERFDPIKAAHAAAKYLKKQFARYNSWPLAMAAYNGGPGTVNVAIDRYNTTDYFKLVQYGAMYDETRRYVPRILAAAIIGRNPEAFGFEGLKPEPPFVFDLVDVPGNTKLNQLAEAAGCPVDTLKELNPELLKDVTPPGDIYALRIPQGKHAQFVERFDQVKKKYANASDTITLRFGETIEVLGEEIGIPARVLRNLNGLGAKQAAAYGTELTVPNGSERAGKANTDEDARPIALISPETFDFRDRTRVFYETQKGDSLREIADAFGVMPNQIALWNECDIWAKLRPHMFLQIFVTSSTNLQNVRYFAENEVQPVVRGSEEHLALLEAKRSKNAKNARAAAKASGKSSSKSSSGNKAQPSEGKTHTSGKYIIHTVQKGDSLSKIAQKYGVSLSSILKLNDLNEKSAIRKGQQLKIKKK
ncbi:MAG: transglycosylase SLT domain-containing protein [Proteobacteria bacterium]|nr:transglycosylase SLT domain-containing protein [Pseudomonadota bacterium]